MLRYFFVAVGLSILSYLVLRSTIGVWILPAVETKLARDPAFFVPAVVSIVVGVFFLRPFIRAHSFFGPVIASLLSPFLVGFFFMISLTIFGGSTSSLFVESFEDTFMLMREVPFAAMESLRVTAPLALVVAFLLRKSDPPETLKRRNLATVDPYQHS